jgi:hypothetical protein
MNPPPIHIERIRIVLRGVPPATAQGAVAGLDPALASAIGKLALPRGGGGTQAPSRPAAPPSVGSGLAADGLRDRIATLVALAVAREVRRTKEPR